MDNLDQQVSQALAAIAATDNVQALEQLRAVLGKRASLAC